MTDESILVWFGPHVNVKRETVAIMITSGSDSCSNVMVLFLKYVMPSALPFSVQVMRMNLDNKEIEINIQYEPDQCNDSNQTEEPSENTTNYRDDLGTSVSST
jgi:hypothetical protein